jgi:hypothetical protein
MPSFIPELRTYLVHLQQATSISVLGEFMETGREANEAGPLADCTEEGFTLATSEFMCAEVHE